MRRRATAVAHPNIALVKYWGKRNAEYNLPAAGSLSLTLQGLSTQTTVEFVDHQPSDLIILNDRVLRSGHERRIVDFLDLMRSISGINLPAVVRSTNDFPTAAGLASSSSGFAALAAACVVALGIDVGPAELSVLARRGSGSAARSILGGFVEMQPGLAEDGSDAYAVPIEPDDHWDLRCLIVLTTRGEKNIGSTRAMEQTRATSPYYQPWIDSVPEDIEVARRAVTDRDFQTLATVAERSCLRMHASAMAADPGIIYWNGLTTTLIHRVRNLRADGLAAFFTIDAGPHVKVFCEAHQVSAVEAMLRAVDGVNDIIRAKPGPGVHIVE